MPGIDAGTNGIFRPNWNMPCLNRLHVYTVNMDTRQKIIGRALKEIQRHGVEGFSVRATGTAAGLSAMAMYRHFENKDDLLRAVGEDAFAVYQQRVSAIPNGPIEPTFKNIARAYVEFALDDPGRFEACFVIKTKVERVYPDDFRAGKSPVIAQMADLIRENQAQGVLAKGDAVEVALLLWAQVHGLVMLHRASRIAIDREDFITLCENAAAKVLKGLQPTPATVKQTKKKTDKRKSK